MSFTQILMLLAIVIALVYLIILYNNLVQLKHACSKALANIDVLLKQRNDELPKLIEVCKRYMSHERETLTDVINARSQAVAAQKSHDMTAVGQAESLLGAGLGKLFAISESYPSLQADEVFVDLQERISELENTISDRREYYNESVNNNNVRIAQFPDLIVANMFGFKEFKLLKFEKKELQNPNMKALFDS